MKYIKVTDTETDESFYTSSSCAIPVAMLLRQNPKKKYKIEEVSVSDYYRANWSFFSSSCDSDCEGDWDWEDGDDEEYFD